MARRILAPTLAVALLSAVLVAASAEAQAIAAGAPRGVVPQSLQVMRHDSTDLLTVVFATLGASVGVAMLASLGYLLRRRLGLDWHRSPGTESEHGQHDEGVLAGVSHGDSTDSHGEKGG